MDTKFHLLLSASYFVCIENVLTNYNSLNAQFTKTWFPRFLLVSTVASFQSPPYSMYADSDKRLTGNDVFEGYAIDLIKEVAEILSKL